MDDNNHSLLARSNDNRHDRVTMAPVPPAEPGNPPRPKIMHRGQSVVPCAREECRTCDEQFLGSAAEDLLRKQHDFRHLPKPKAENMLDNLGKSVEDAFDCFRVAAKAMIPLIPSLEDSVVDALFQAAFPLLLTETQYNNLRCRKLGKIRALPALNQPLKFGRLHKGLLTSDPSLKHTLEHLSKRFDFPPSRYVSDHETYIGLGWSMFMFNFTTAHLFINLQHQSYRNAKLTHPMEPNALHSENVFTFERGLLILQSQQAWYAGWAGFFESVHDHFSSMGRVISTSSSMPEVNQADNSFRRAWALMDELLAKIGTCAEAHETEYGRFCRGQARNRAALGTLQTWLDVEAGCPPEVQLAQAIETHVFSLMDRLLASRRLQTKAQQLRSAIKGWMQRTTTRTKVLEARDGVEETLFEYLRTIASSFLRNHSYLGHAFFDLDRHNNSYRELLQCADNHSDIGVSRGFWLLFGLIEPCWPSDDIIKDCCDAISSERIHFRDGVNDRLEPCLNTASHVFNVLREIGPCCDPWPLDSDSIETLCRRLLISPRALAVSKEMEKEDNAILKYAPESFSEVLWSTSYQCLEEFWERVELDDDEKAYRRRIFGMQKKKRTPKPKVENVAEEKEAQSAENTNTKTWAVGQQLQTLEADTSNTTVTDGDEDGRQPEAHPPSTPKPKPTPKSRRVDYSIIKDDDIVSENIRWATNWQPKPSQFGEDGSASSCSKKPKRRDLCTNEDADQDSLINATTTLNLAASEPPAPLIFTNIGIYQVWRQLFPHPEEQEGGRQRIRWGELRQALASAPLNFIEVRVGGMVSQKWRRMEGDGHDEQTITLHMPHGGENSWLEKEHLQTIRVRMRHAFGWSPDSFEYREPDMTNGGV